MKRVTKVARFVEPEGDELCVSVTVYWDDGTTSESGYGCPTVMDLGDLMTAWDGLVAELVRDSV